jgi:hypothetical protein
MKAFICLTIAILLALVGVAGALPSTVAATNITNNGFTIGCTGAVNTTQFHYGTNPSNLNIWTMELSPVGGVVTSVEYSSPIMPSTHYYITACDSTGCDATPAEFTTLALTPIPVSTLGTAITNMTRNRFNILYLPGNIAVPYGWLFPSDQGSQTTAIEIVAGMLFFFAYVGLWLRTRSVATGVIIGLLTSSFILFADTGLNIGIPVEFSAIAQALLYASLAGIILAWLKK